ncbi:MAG: M28 family peptidase [Saprospiraceae bacterium]
MKKLGIFLLLAGMGITAGAQSAKEKDAQKFAATITAEDLKKHLYIVAGPEMEGRNTPSEGLRKAATYIETHFSSLGLTKVAESGYQMPYSLYTDSLISAKLEVNGKTWVQGTDFSMPTSNYNASVFAGEVVFAGYGLSDSTRNDYKDLDVKGKLVLVLSGMPAGGSNGGGRRPQFVNKQAIAAQYGALAVLQVQENLSPMRGAMGNRPYLNLYKKSTPPNLCLIKPDVAQAISGLSLNDLQAAANQGKTGQVFSARVAMTMEKAVLQVPTANVLGFLEGSDLKDEVLVLTAHYDHVGKSGNDIFYGADDDGSGTVSILELAQAFSEAKKAGKGPRRSILFMTVSGEEKGLWGSAYYSDYPVFPLDKTVCNLNIDMIGRIGSEYQKDKDSANYVYVIGDDKLSSALRPISETANQTYTKLKLDYKYNDPNDPNRFYYRSDHYNFAEKGVPIIFYFNGTHADYHRPTDTPDKINYPLMAKRAQLVFYTAWEIANRNQGIPRDQNNP